MTRRQLARHPPHLVLALRRNPFYVFARVAAACASASGCDFAAFVCRRSTYRRGSARVLCRHAHIDHLCRHARDDCCTCHVAAAEACHRRRERDQAEHRHAARAATPGRRAGAVQEVPRRRELHEEEARAAFAARAAVPPRSSSASWVSRSRPCYVWVVRAVPPPRQLETWREGGREREGGNPTDPIDQAPKPHLQTRT